MNLNAKRRIIIDTDLSLGELAKDVDDGLALIMALNSPRLDILAVSGVYGNTSLTKVIQNLHTLKQLYLPFRPFPEILTGASSKKDFTNNPKIPGIAQMADIIATDSQQITLVAIGPLTNIALLFQRYPEIIRQIDELVIMGGKINGWEFNFANDPAATDFVLQTPIKKIICGLEVCTAQKFTSTHYNRLRCGKYPLQNYLLHGIRNWLALNRCATVPLSKGGFFPFDPTAIAYILEPTLFQTVLIPARHVNPIKKPQITPPLLFPGWKTYIDPNQWQNRNKIKTKKMNAWSNWALKIDSERFMELLLTHLMNHFQNPAAS